MNKREYCESRKSIAYYSGLNGLEIKVIEYGINAGGNKYVVNCPCIHISGSVAGMRRDFWGYKCDVVRVGQWIYKAN